MNYQHLRYFREVAQSESYQQAADRLFVTQPTLSRAISSLEDELKVDLFEKIGRRARLTPFGRAFLSYVEQSLNALDQGIAEIENMREEVSGNISVATVYGYSYYYLPKIVGEFSEIYPHVKFDLSQMPTQKVLEAVSEGVVDLGIHLPANRGCVFKNIDTYQIGEVDMVVIVSKRHPLAKRASCRLAELESTQMISFNAFSGLLYKTMAMFQEAGLHYTSNLTVGGDQSLLNLVGSGVGAACVLRNVGASSSDVTTLEIEDAVDKRVQILMSMRRGVHRSRMIRAFANYLLKMNPN